MIKIIRPLAFLALIILLVGLACGPTVAPTQAPAPPPQQPQQTEPPAPTPTEALPTEAPPTEAPSDEAPVYFTEEFDDSTDLSRWTYFEAHGKDDDVNLSKNSGYLVFDLNKENLWVYVTYNPWSYKNVRIDARVENRGVNNNNVSLVCRYSDEGWYEFNIANNGLYNIYAATFNAQGKIVYNFLANGGSNKIKMGKDTNEYTAICKEKTLSLYINGYETKVLTENKYVLREGAPGISVSSFDTLPVKVEVDWFKISEP